MIQPFADAIEQDRRSASRSVACERDRGARAARRADRPRKRAALLRSLLLGAPVRWRGVRRGRGAAERDGREDRAFAWLEYDRLDPPPSRGLESLGILKARRGEPDAARGLWEKGLSVDGHPDFFSHLAQLSFAEGSAEAAWDFVERGLRRIRERTRARRGVGRRCARAAVLLECLQEHLADRVAPPKLAASLVGLKGLLSGDDRVSLGLCLFSMGQRIEAAQSWSPGCGRCLMRLRAIAPFERCCGSTSRILKALRQGL